MKEARVEGCASELRTLRTAVEAYKATENARPETMQDLVDSDLLPGGTIESYRITGTYFAQGVPEIELTAAGTDAGCPEP